MFTYKFKRYNGYWVDPTHDPNGTPAPLPLNFLQRMVLPVSWVSLPSVPHVQKRARHACSHPPALGAEMAAARHAP